MVDYEHELDFKTSARIEMNRSRAKNKGEKHYKSYIRNQSSNYIKKECVRNFIFKRDGYKCVYCNSEENLQIDHIVSVYNGGQNKICNLQTLCRSCNARKSV